MRQGIEDEVHDVLVGQRVVDVLAVAAADHDILGPQDAQSLRDRGQAFVARRRQLRHAGLPLRQNGQNPQSRRFTESSKEPGRTFKRLVVY